MAVQAASDSVEGLPFDDAMMLTEIGDALVGDVAHIDRVGEQLVEMPAGKRLAARPLPSRYGALSRLRSGGFAVRLESTVGRKAYRLAPGEPVRCIKRFEM